MEADVIGLESVNAHKVIMECTVSLVSVFLCDYMAWFHVLKACFLRSLKMGVYGTLQGACAI